MKKALAIVLAATLMLALAAGCNQTAAPAATTAAPAATTAAPAATTAAPSGPVYDKVEFSYATASSGTSSQGTACYYFKEMVEKRSGGAVKVNVFDSAVLGSQKELTESVNNGTIEMAYSTTSLLTTYVPECAVFSLPFIFANDRQAQKAVQTSGVAEKLKEKMLGVSKIHILAFMAGGARDMMTNGVPITKLEEFKGVKFRSPEAFEYTSMFEALGATPTPMPFTEMYQAVKTKLVDGLETNAMFLVDDKYYEVGTHVMLTKHINTVEAIIMNENFYKSLSADTQKLIQDCIDETEAWEFENRMARAESAVEDLKKLGLKVIELDTAPLSEACQAVYEKFIVKNPGAADLVKILQAAR